MSVYDGLFWCRYRKEFFRWTEFITYLNTQRWMDEQYGWLNGEEEEKYSQ